MRTNIHFGAVAALAVGPAPEPAFARGGRGDARHPPLLGVRAPN